MLTRPAVASALAAAAFLLMHLPTTAQTPTFELPKPTGPHAVGTTAWRITDPFRRETFADGAREVEVVAWYPAAAASRTPAPYLREGQAEARTWATLLKAPDTTFDGLAAVVTHATLDAPPVKAPAMLPVLLFSHGYTSLTSAYTALMEDLASHGYVALGIVHPYEVAVATLGDGRSVTMLDEAGTLRQGIRDVFAEWGPEDATMAKVTAAAGVEEQRTLLRGYLSKIPQTDLALRRWVDDTTLVLNSLARPVEPSSNGAGLLAGRYDLARVGAFGHSMGGVTAAQFCAEERRCRAALNLDGIPQYGTLIDKPLDRPFLMVYSARPGRAGASDAIYARAASPYYRVDIRETLHLDFCDLNFWGGPMRERGAFGALAPARAAELTRLIVREFFDQTLLKKTSRLLSNVANVPEVTVRRMDR
jgi:pimeloyl-ACP methyl ester carboxylesterase